MKNLKYTLISDWVSENGVLQNLDLSFQSYGPAIGTAPVVLVNHALTGNSNVAGPRGWWSELIGGNKTIDTDHFTVIAFNIPGNGFDDNADNLIFNYRDFTAKDIASIFWKGLENLNITKLFAVIGGSLGGGIAWEMALQKPDAIQNLIPIATDWKATDWVIANVFIQDKILNNSDDPVSDARLHAMLLYRTPESLTLKFNRKKSKNQNAFQIENWLIHHGSKLQNRFRLSSYKLMNHLLGTIDISKNETDFLSLATQISSRIHLIAVNTDLFFIPSETQQTFVALKSIDATVFYNEIKSIHGHDAFLIENDQLATILRPIFKMQLATENSYKS